MNKAGRKMTSKEMLKFYSDNLFEEAMEKKKKGGWEKFKETIKETFED